MNLVIFISLITLIAKEQVDAMISICLYFLIFDFTLIAELLIKASPLIHKFILIFN